MFVFLSTHRGYFKRRDQRYLIEPLKFTDQKEHAVLKYGDKTQSAVNDTCGVHHLSKRQAGVQTSKSDLKPELQTYLQQKKHIELFIVADNAMYHRSKRKQRSLRNRIFGMVNFVNMIYKTLDIQVVLVGLEIWTNGDEVEVNSDLGTTLLHFGSWQETVLKKRKNFDHAQLLSGKWLSQKVQGIAYPWGMCTPYHSTSVAKDHSYDANMVADTIAHELAHSIGMQHDTYSCPCPYGRCVMDGGISIPSQGFSKCNHNQFHQYLLDFRPKCILNAPLSRDIVTHPRCGNRILEEGEECDCGSPQDCTNVCCEAKTCTRKPGFTCGEGECCEGCHLKKAGTMCRPAKDECDIPEMCDGLSFRCPQDRFQVNGFPCKTTEGYCFNGKCPTRDSQCLEIFKGESEGGHDICYRRNSGGDKFGYCKKVNNRFIPCAEKDLKCGKIYCSGGMYLPSYGEDRIYYIKIKEENIIVECKAFFLLGHSEDIGLVAPGTKCGDGKVCSNGECVDIERAYKLTNCSSHCKGHVVCDHELHCQCEERWAPSKCEDHMVTASFSIVAGVLVTAAVLTVVIALLVWHKISAKQKQVQRQPSAISGIDNEGYAWPEPQMNGPQDLPHGLPTEGNPPSALEDSSTEYSSPHYITMPLPLPLLPTLIAPFSPRISLPELDQGPHGSYSRSSTEDGDYH
uniref:ADAM metallopeptidase domain 7 n=1 Tax=Ornithorhynchus anatinus TaxID=9258 RepID=A0A6I8MY00_ORNAN